MIIFVHKIEITTPLHIVCCYQYTEKIKTLIN